MSTTELIYYIAGIGFGMLVVSGNTVDAGFLAFFTFLYGNHVHERRKGHSQTIREKFDKIEAMLRTHSAPPPQPAQREEYRGEIVDI